MIRKTIFIFTVCFIAFGCTKLEETYPGQLTEDQIGGGSGGGGNVTALLNGVYGTIRGTFQNQDGVWALSEMTTDELIGPTRGGDWDDNGAWRVLHNHKFNGDNTFVTNVFNALGGVIYSATDMLRFSPTAQQAAEARMLRAFAMYLWLDGWNQVPYRDPGESNLTPARVRVGMDALTYIMSELTAIIPDLPTGPVTRANKNAARVLLMKCYLNKGVYANRAAPTFDAADMNQVISLADLVIAGGYAFTPNYFDNFAPANTTIGTENIWTQENVGGVSGGDIRSHWYSVMHYNMQPSGWNGFSSLSDFYNKFEATDKRRGVAYPSNNPAFSNPGGHVNVGFLIGQQYDMRTGVALKDRTGAPLAFTPQVSIIEKGTNLEVTGIRAYKYPIDYLRTDQGNVDNDMPYFRLADVILMKAEALLRTNNATAATTLVNSIRTKVGATSLGTVTLDNLIDERGRELYLETWRRQDLIRFGKFLLPWQEKPASDPRNLLFPIPNGQLAANPNLVQNPGY